MTAALMQFRRRPSITWLVRTPQMRRNWCGLCRRPANGLFDVPDDVWPPLHRRGTAPARSSASLAGIGSPTSSTAALTRHSTAARCRSGPTLGAPAMASLQMTQPAHAHRGSSSARRCASRARAGYRRVGMVAMVGMVTQSQPGTYIWFPYRNHAFHPRIAPTIPTIPHHTPPPIGCMVASAAGVD